MSSFGISGTNAHVILEEPMPEPVQEVAPEAASGPYLWVLSANSAASLRGQASRLHDHLTANPSARPVDVAYSLATTRASFDHRAVVVGTDRAALLEALTRVAEGRPDPMVITGTRPNHPVRTVFLFTGQGGQRPGMGRDLYDAYPVFAKALDEVCAALDPYLELPLREVMWASGDRSALLNETYYTQPALFAYEVAAFRLLESFGATPGMVAGHSVGELAAAHVAGVWNLADAARLVTTRARLMQELPAKGAMVAIAAPHDDVRASLAGKEHLVGIAAVNSPTDVVISGDEEACLVLAEQWRERGARTARLPVSHAFHSPLMEPMLHEFANELKTVAFHEPHLAYESNLGPDRRWSDREYWVDQVRGTVLFAPMLARMAAAGVDICVEIGPKPVLSAPARVCFADTPIRVAATARRGSEVEAFATCLAEAHAAGAEVSLAELAAGGRAIELPTYAFDRENYWLIKPPPSVDVGTVGLHPLTHPLLRGAVEVASGNRIFTGRVSPSELPWLTDHAIGSTVVVPGAALLDCVLEAATHAGYGRVVELTFEAPLVMPATGGLELQLVLDTNAQSVEVFARPVGAESWTRHASRGRSPRHQRQRADANGHCRGHHPAPSRSCSTAPTNTSALGYE